MTYIKIENKKAYDYLISQGFTLSKGVHIPEDMEVYGYEESIKYSFPVYYVKTEMSGTQFHKYLEERGLLLSQQ